MGKKRRNPTLTGMLMIAGFVASQPGAALAFPGQDSRSRSLPAVQLIARATHRIERDRVEIHVYQDHHPVEITRFQELLVATPVDGDAALDRLVQKSVALVRSEKHEGQWDVYMNVWTSINTSTLAENVFIVRQVLVSTRKHPVQVRVNGGLHRLKPGEALLVLG